MPGLQELISDYGPPTTSPTLHCHSASSSHVISDTQNSDYLTLLTDALLFLTELWLVQLLESEVQYYSNKQLRPVAWVLDWQQVETEKAGTNCYRKLTKAT